MSCLEAQCNVCGKLYFGNSVAEILELKSCDCKLNLEVTYDETGQIITIRDKKDTLR